MTDSITVVEKAIQNTFIKNNKSDVLLACTRRAFVNLFAFAVKV
jgi:hypothetical protein